MTKDEIRMSKEIPMTKDHKANFSAPFVIQPLAFSL